GLTRILVPSSKCHSQDGCGGMVVGPSLHPTPGDVKNQRDAGCGEFPGQSTRHPPCVRGDASRIFLYAKTIPNSTSLSCAGDHSHRGAPCRSSSSRTNAWKGRAPGATAGCSGRNRSSLPVGELSTPSALRESGPPGAASGSEG